MREYILRRYRHMLKVAEANGDDELADLILEHIRDVAMYFEMGGKL